MWIRQGIKARRTRNEGRVRALKALREERKSRREQIGQVNISMNDGDNSGKLVSNVKHLNLGYGDKTLVKISPPASCVVTVLALSVKRCWQIHAHSCDFGYSTAWYHQIWLSQIRHQSTNRLSWPITWPTWFRSDRGTKRRGRFWFCRSGG